MPRKIVGTMQVEVLDYTRNWKEIIYKAVAASHKDFEGETIENIIKLLIENDYGSVLEHITITFRVSNISIAVARELLEHCIGISHTGRSTRYNDESEHFTYYVPPNLPDWAFNKYIKLMHKIEELYKQFLEHGISREKARYLLPLAKHTEYVITMNLRSLRHFLALRLCIRASPEIRALAEMIKKKSAEIFPFVKDFGCRGWNQGACPENLVRPRNCPYLNKIKTVREVKWQRSLA